MMKNISKMLAGGFLFLGLLLLASCAEDKGNYNYQWLQRIEVSYPVRTDFILWTRGEPVTVDLQFIDSQTGESVGIDTADYQFNWYALPYNSNYERDLVYLGDKPNLDEPMMLEVSANYHTILMEAFHKELGTNLTTSFRIRLTGAFQDAYLLLMEDDARNVELELYGRDADGARPSPKLLVPE